MENTTPLYRRLSIMDEACIMYEMKGWDFLELFETFINPPEGTERYVFISPEYMLLGSREEQEDPDDPNSPECAPYWHVSFALSREGNPLLHFLRLMPYPLDFVSYERSLKYPDRPSVKIPLRKIIAIYANDSATTTTSFSTCCFSTDSSGGEASKDGESFSSSVSGSQSSQDGGTVSHWYWS